MGREKLLAKVKGSTFRAMEDVREKLKCLDYELLFVRELNQQPVSNDEFVLPSTKNTALQFNHYIQLIKWLLSQIIYPENEGAGTARGGACSEFENVDTFDDPNVIAQKLMLSLRELAFDIDFPVTKLKQPYGEEAISILNFLTDKVLNSRDFEYILEPKYITADKMNNENNEKNQSEGEAEEVIDTDEETFDESNDSIELCYEITNFDNYNRFMTSNDAATKTSTTHGMISSKVDPVAWRIELERVSPALDINFEELENDTTLGRSWRMQVKNVLTENEKISNEMERSNDVFQRLRKESHRTLEMIDVKEQIINEKFKHITDEHNLLCDKLCNLEETSKESSISLNEMNAEISSLTKKLNKVKRKVDEKGNRMTDTSPLIQIKTTLKDIKAEIRDYDLQIGILEHKLIHGRLAKANV